MDRNEWRAKLAEARKTEAAKAPLECLLSSFPLIGGAAGSPLMAQADRRPDPTGPGECRSRARQARLAAGLLDGEARAAALAAADDLDRRADAWAKADADRQLWSERALAAAAADDRDAWRSAWERALAAHRIREAARLGEPLPASS